MKKIVLGVVSVAVVAVGGVWVAVTYFLDSNTIAGELKKEVATRFNRELVFNGNLETKFFPKVEIVLPPTTLSYEGQTKPQFTLTGAKVGVAVLPLLKGDIQFDDIQIEGLKGVVNAKRFTQKIDQKKSEPTSEQANTKKEDSSFVKNLRVDSVSIKDCALTVYGLQNQKVYAVNHLNLQTGEIQLKGQTPVTFSTNFEEKTQGLTGSLQVQTTADYDLNTLDVTLSNLKTNLTVNQANTASQLGLQAKQVGYKQRDIEVQGLNVEVSSGQDLVANLSAKQFKTASMKDWMLSDVKADLRQGQNLTMEVKGNFSGSVDAMSLVSNDLNGWVKSVVNGQSLQVPMKGGVKANVSQESASANLTGQFDAQPWSLVASVKGFSKPTVQGNFKLAKLTVDKWLPKDQQPKVAQMSMSPINEAMAATTGRLTALEALDADFGFKIDEVLYKKLLVKDVATQVRLKGGVLTLQNMKGNVAQGTLLANVKLDAAQKWSLTQQAQNVKLEQVLAGLELPTSLTGTVKMNTQLSGIGLDEVAIKKNANGSVSAEVQNAVLKGVSLEKIALAVRNKQIGGLIMMPEDQTKFTALKANVRVANSMLDITNVTGQSSVASVKGQVRVGLLDNTLSGKTSAVLATSVGGRQVTVPITISGTVSEPSYGIDLTSAIKDNLTQDLKDKGKEKLQEGIGKLLNRLSR